MHKLIRIASVVLYAGVTTTLVVSPLSLRAQSCKPEQSWELSHTQAKTRTLTQDIKGSRATRIEVCRADEPSGANLKVVVQYEGMREPQPLAVADCTDRFAKWAVIKSTGTQTESGGAAMARGSYKICRE